MGRRGPDRGVREVGEVDVRVPDALLLLAELRPRDTRTQSAAHRRASVHPSEGALAVRNLVPGQVGTIK